ncbi:MAG: four-helix bundle copper-binding protein [Nitrosospira sp.]|nr:four-helix bundle copper-binding protein [Nitrosospira sp.]
MTHTTDPKMQACVDACNQCYQTCLHEAMTQCLEAGGKHVEPDHFRLMMNCAEICQTSVNFMLSSSAFSNQTCRVCAEVCEACAKSCEQIGMEDCARVCRECAESCRQMAGSGTNESAGARERVPADDL